MKIRNFSVVWLFLYFFSSAVFAETITIVTLSPTGVATQDVRTKAVGESINVVVKPKVGFKGVVKIDGSVVATGEVNRVLRYKYRVAGNSTVETSYIQVMLNNKSITIGNYTVDEIVAPIEAQTQNFSGKLALPEGTKLKRSLYSMETGEVSDNVTSQGRLSDVAYVEIQDFSDITEIKDDIIQRTIYQSFNVGKWKNILNTETTLLTKIFISEPVLIFLTETEKEQLANFLLSNDEFSQAKVEYEKIISESTEQNPELLDELVISLGELSQDQLNSEQIIRSGGVLRSKIRQLRQGVTKKSTFPVFNGMDLGYDSSLDELSVYSRSSLWYGIQSEENFNKGGFSGWSSTSLITPKVGFVTKEDFNFIQDIALPIDGAVITKLGLDDIDTKINQGETINTVLYRNNPESWVDAPQVMNMLSVVQVVLEAAPMAEGLLKSISPKKVIKTVNGFANKVTEFKKNNEDKAQIISVFLDVALLTADLSCGKDVACKTSFSNVVKTKNILEKIYSNTLALSSEPDETTYTAKDYRRESKNAIVEFTKMLSKNARGKKQAKRKRGFYRFLKAVLLSKLIIQPIIKKGTGKEIDQLVAYKLARGLLLKSKTKEKQFKEYFSLATKKGAIDPKRLLNIYLHSVKETLKTWTSFTKFADNIKKISAQDVVYGILVDAAMSANTSINQSVFNLIKNVTPAKYFDLLMTGNKAGAMIYDWLTDPTLVRLSMKKTDKLLDVTHTLPDLKAIRYLNIPSANNKLIDKSIPGGHKVGKTIWSRNDEKLFALGTGAEDNHFLVMSGFKSSLENQTAFKKDDKSQVTNLMENKKINMLWHVKQFPLGSSTQPVLLGQRTLKTAFNSNFVNKSLDNTFLWFTNAIVNTHTNNPVQKSVLNTKIGDYETLDFTAFYKNETGNGSDYPLSHVTPGIYSDYTHISFKTSQEKKVFTNTINMYVLPDFTSYADRLQADAKYFKGVNGLDSELQLTFRASSNWNEVAPKGLWMVLEYPLNGKLYKTIPIEIFNLPTSGMPVKSYSIPANVNLAMVKVFIYNEIIDTYIQKTGKSVRRVLNWTQSYIRDNQDAPLIYLDVSKMAETTKSLLILKDSDKDSDKDGMADIFDDFPEDERYQFDSDEDGIADRWEIRYSLDEYDAADANIDSDNDGLSNLEEFRQDSNPKESLITLNVVAGNTQAIATWGAIDGAAIYNLYYATTPDGSEGYQKIENAISPYTVRGLTNGTTYYLATTSEDIGGGESEQSNIVSVTPTENIVKDKPAKDWVKLLGIEYSEADAIEIDKNNNIYVIGKSFNKEIEKSQVFIKKFSESGLLQWERTVIGRLISRNIITIDNKGNIFITALAAVSRSEEKFDGHKNKNEVDMFILKFDSNGNKLWSELFNYDERVDPSAITTDINGNVFITGTTRNKIFDGISSYGSDDAFIMSYDPNGNKRWSQLYGNTGIDSSKDIKIDNLGNVYITGSTYLYHNDDTQGNSDMFIVKYDNNGNKLWDNILLGSKGSEGGHQLNIDHDNNIFVIFSYRGSSNIFEGYTVSPNGLHSYFQYFGIKLNTLGEKQWIKPIGSPLLHRFLSNVYLTSNGNIYGYFTHGYNDNVYEGTHQLGGTDIFLTKLTMDGDEWSIRLGGSRHDKVKSIAVINNQIYLIGKTNSPIFEGEENIYSGNGDSFIIKLTE